MSGAEIFEIFGFLSKNQNFRITIFFYSTTLFYQNFYGDDTLSEKPKNGIKNCDFDFGWSKCWSEPSEIENPKIHFSEPRFRSFPRTPPSALVGREVVCELL